MSEGELVLCVSRSQDEYQSREDIRWPDVLQTVVFVGNCQGGDEGGVGRSCADEELKLVL